MPTAIVPAAGASERFGGIKAVADVWGRPMLERVIDTLRAAEVDHIVVVLGDHEDSVRDNVPGLMSCRLVRNEHPERGMFSSLQVGFAAAPDETAYVVAIGDMPFVRPETVRALVAEHGRNGGIVSPRYRGKRGHPIVVDAAVRDAVLASPTTITLHDVIRTQSERRHDLDVDDPGVVRDVDTMKDLDNA